MNAEYPMSNFEGKYIVRFSLQHSKFNIRHSIFLEAEVKDCFPVGEMNGL
jgi:hypothetical protein